MDAGYPRPISDGFPGIPDNLDAAIQWARNGNFYFFKGSHYWRYDFRHGRSNPPVLSSGYPKSINLWGGVPHDIDGALVYHTGWTYFFKGNKYYRFYDDLSQVSTSNKTDAFLCSSGVLRRPSTALG